MYRRFVYFKSKIFIKLYEIITHFFILYFKNKKTCFTYFIKIMKKRINRVIISRKNKILNFIFINTCELFLKSFIKNITFLKIIDNRSRKI